MGKKKKFDYFDMFERQSKLAVREATLLVKSVENFTEAKYLEEIMERAHELENEADEICHEIYKNIATDFITPIEREDIIEMTSSIDTIIDHIEEIIIRFYMYDIHTMHEGALEFAQLIKKSCEALDLCMEDFRNFKKSKTFKNRIIDVNTFEEEGDALFMRVIRQLFTEETEHPVRVLVWSETFERMERCCDDCEHAADIMTTIMLKNV